MLTLNVNQFNFHPNTNLYTQEISSLGNMERLPTEFVMQDCPTVGESTTFRFRNADRHDDEIAGWRFDEHLPKKKPLRVLIIND